MTPQIPDKHRVESLLRQAGVKGKISVFGSRATGTAKPFSDLDLLVDAGEPLSLRVMAKFEVLLEDSDLSFQVDLVDARRASATFLAAIAPDCIPLSLETE